MPEAAVDENGNLEPRKDDVDAPTRPRDRAVHVKSQPTAMEF